MITFRWGAAADVGQVRQVNQDSVLAEEPLFAVADGMGGHRGGEVASDVAITALKQHFTVPTIDALVAAVQAANDAVVSKASQDSELRGMGTTMCALALVQGADGLALGVANVGDSRAYLLRAGEDEVHQVTEDHSLVETLVRQGQLTRADAAVHPQRNILTRALGIDQRVLVDAWGMRPVVGDRYLLCSDGLFNEVDEHRIGQVMRDAAPQEAAEELVRLANEGGGRDNISVVIVEIAEVPDESELAPTAVGDDRVVTVVYGTDRARAEVEAEVAAGSGPATQAQPAIPPNGTASPSASAPAGAPPVAAAPVGAAGPRPAAPTRFTWRVGLFAAAFVVLLGGTALAVNVVASQTWHVTFASDDSLALYQGPEGGFLWVQPSEEQRFNGLTPDRVPADQRQALEEGKTFDSQEKAEAYVAGLLAEIEATENAAVDGIDDGIDAGADGDSGTGAGGLVPDAPSGTAGNPQSTDAAAAGAAEGTQAGDAGGDVATPAVGNPPSGIAGPG